MCGIAGYVLNHGRADGALVQQMCDQIRHRGPDDAGFYVDGGCAIGMRRLSIIDLHTGHQPIANEDRSAWIVFNGEIYNFQQLREDLAAKGHVFHTRTDTEAILHLYEEYGVAGFTRLRGMFAFAIWDVNRRELVLARDRFGKKPLYYAALSEGLYFGSEMKCLNVAGVPQELDDEALRLYFQFSYVPDPRSAFRAIRKLSPGGWLRYRGNGTVEQGRYWELPAAAEVAPAGLTEKQACARIVEIFDESVRLRMIADVPLGAFLSGGIDSSLVVAAMARQSDQRVKTFSIGFDEAEFSELPYAAQLAKQYNTEHHEIIVRPDAVDLVGQLVDHFDEPFGDSSSIPTYLVSQFAAQHVKVVLTGDGGDEIFAGYESFWAIDRLRRFDALPQALRSVIAAIADRLPYSTYGKNYLRMISRPSALDRYFELNYAHYYLRRRLLAPHWMAAGDEAYVRSRIPGALLEGDHDIVTQALYFEATAKLTGDMLVKVDRMSMANSLEVRCPLLDHTLAEYAAKLPHSWKMNGGRGKLILLKALGDRLPPGLINRKKMGFGVPLPVWFRGKLRSFLWDHLTSTRFEQRGMISPPFVRHLLEEHDRGRRNNSHWLWSLLMLELWFRNWEERAPHPVSRTVGTVIN